MALLELHDLHTYFTTKRGIVKAVNGVSYSVDSGRTLGVVGESGSGKSVSAMSILQLLDGNGYIDSGSIIFDGKEIEKLSASQKVHEKPLSLLGQRALSLIHPSSIGSCIVYAGSPILSGINYDYARLWYTLLRCPTSTTSILSSWSEMLLIKR